jgi:23S rRNA (guanine745-N1)-methyltransferase
MTTRASRIVVVVPPRRRRTVKVCASTSTTPRASPTPWRCPTCGNDDDAELLTKSALLQRQRVNDSTVYRCRARGHAFDEAKSGYVNLIDPRRTRRVGGDGGAQLRARRRFLRAGRYAELADAVAEEALREEEEEEEEEANGGSGDGDNESMIEARVDEMSPRAKKLAKKRRARRETMAKKRADGLAEPRRRRSIRVVDFGCGEGYYSSVLLERASERDDVRVTSLACLDASKDACDMAAKSLRDAGAFVAVADATRDLPLPEDSVDVALSVFAPRSPSELARVLRSGGRVVIASPEPEHMRELRSAFDAVKVLGVEPGKAERVAETMREAGFSLVRTRSIVGTMDLGIDDVVAIIQMGPSGHHNTEEEIMKAARAAGPTTTRVTKAFSVSVFTKVT